MRACHRGNPSLFPLAAALAVALLFLACDTGDGVRADGDFVPGRNAVACGNWTAYVEDVTGYRVLKIEGIGIGEETGTETLPAGGEQLAPRRADIALYRMNKRGAVADWFCNDVYTGIRIVDSLTAHSGSVRARKYDRDPEPFFPTFRLDLEVRDARFRREDGSEARIELLRLDSLLAGWLAG